VFFGRSCGPAAVTPPQTTRHCCSSFFADGGPNLHPAKPKKAAFNGHSRRRRRISLISKVGRSALTSAVRPGSSMMVLQSSGEVDRRRPMQPGTWTQCQMAACLRAKSHEGSGYLIGRCLYPPNRDQGWRWRRERVATRAISRSRAAPHATRRLISSFRPWQNLKRSAHDRQSRQLCLLPLSSLSAARRPDFIATVSFSARAARSSASCLSNIARAAAWRCGSEIVAVGAAPFVGGDARRVVAAEMRASQSV